MSAVSSTRFNSQTDVSISPHEEENPWTSQRIAELLWLDPCALIDSAMVTKVNAAHSYLTEQSFMLRGVVNDGDCFFTAFYESSCQIERSFPLIEEQENPVSYLRQVASELNKDVDGEGKKWVSFDEGKLLASFFQIPIRLLTPIEDGNCSDIVIFEDPSRGEVNWDNLHESERPDEFLFLVDFGGHFVWASPIQAEEEAALPERPPPIFPSPLDFADFDSVTISTGIVETVNFNPDDEYITIQFPSPEAFQKMHRAVSDKMAASGKYALAKAHWDAGGKVEDLPSLEWLDEGLEATRTRIEEGENPEDFLWKNTARSQQLQTTKENKWQAYQETMTQIQEGFHTGKLEKVFELLAKAKSLNPTSFEPHLFSLFLLGRLVQHVMQDDFFEVVREAYELSPVQTFTALMHQFFLAEFSKSLLSQNLFTLFFAQFPSDFLGYLVAHEIEEQLGISIHENAKGQADVQRELFAEKLQEALQALQTGKLDLARQLFAQAKPYHISDKRTYLFNALLSLHRGDKSFALKLATDVRHLVDWTNLESRIAARNQFFYKVTGLTTYEGDPPPEIPEIKILLHLTKTFDVKVEQIEELRNEFLQIVETYLETPAVDWLFLDQALEVAEEQLWPTLESGKTLQSYLQLQQQVFEALYGRLYVAGEDLTEFDMLLEERDERLFLKYDQLPVFAHENELVLLEIDPDSLLVPTEVENQLALKLASKTYEKLAFSFFRYVALPEAYSDILNGLPIDESSSLNPRFLATFLEGIDELRDPNLQAKMIQWVTRHEVLLPSSLYPHLTKCFCRWLLALPLPSLASERLITAAQNWFASEKSHHSTLELALTGWSALLNGQLKAVEAILQPFFHDWEKNFSKGFAPITHNISSLDPVALRTICLTQALLERPDYIRHLPRSTNTRTHGELIECALSMIAREGVARPYVIPPGRVSSDSFQALAQLYIGQQIDENDTDYAARIRAEQFASFDDMRLAPQVRLFEIEEEPKEWVMPALWNQNEKQMRALIEEAITLNKIRVDKTNHMRNDSPSYTDNPFFIRWVEEYENIIPDYLKDPQKVLKTCFQQFPKLPQKARDLFKAELEKKAIDLQEYRELQKKTPKPEKKPAKRFWQLVEQTAELIESVQQGNRQRNTYNIIVSTEEEAHLVMKLIFEWSRPQWTGSLQTLGEAFHGPETHIWGTGPRILHFNAGVFIHNPNEDTLSNTHIFF